MIKALLKSLLIFLIFGINTAFAESATPDVEIDDENPPQITSVQMRIVPEAEWTLIVEGNNLGTNPGTLMFDNDSKKILKWNDTEIQAAVKAGTKSGKLTVTTAAQKTITLQITLNISATITGIYPAAAYNGGTLTIIGYELGNDEGEVFINDKSVDTVNFWNQYEIHIIIPETATSGKIRIKTADGTFSNSVSITIKERPQPEVQYLSPASGFPGDTVNIYGAFFGSKQGEIMIDNQVMPISAWADNVISFTVPEGTKSGNLIITVDGKSSNLIPYSINALPKITSVEPLAIIPGKTLVTIRGSGFKDAWYIGSNIYFNGVISEFITEWTDNKIVALPPSNVSAGPITLKIVNVPQITVGSSFTIKTDVSYINPKAGKAGDQIKIVGNNFGNEKGTIMVGNVKAEITLWENKIIQFIIPAGTSDGKIRLIKSDGSENSDFSVEILKVISNDPYSHLQWYLTKIKADTGWNEAEYKKEVVVAIIDDGVDTNHPDLTNNIWKNDQEIIGNYQDDEQNGYMDDSRGWNFISNSNELTPNGSHGTMVAGIIAAQLNNGIGIAGISAAIKIMPLIACEQDGCAGSKVVEAIKYAADNGADVINLSLGGAHFTNTYSQGFDEGIKYAYGKGLIIVSAAGNGDLISNEGRNLNTNPTSPACNDSGKNMVLAVAALDRNDKKANWSDYGSNCIDISAPGVEIYTTVPPAYDPDFDAGQDITKFGYDIGYGTSFAAPQVAAAAALLKAIHPDWKNAEITRALVETADNIDSQNPSFIGQLGGRLNIINAIRSQKPAVDESLWENDSKNTGQENLAKNSDGKNTETNENTPKALTEGQKNTVINSSGTFSNLRASEVKNGSFDLLWDTPANLSNVSHYLVYGKNELNDQYQVLRDQNGNIMQFASYMYGVTITVTFQLKYTYKVEMYDKSGRLAGTLLLEVNLKPIPEKFSDVSLSHKNAVAINFLKDKRILEGYPDGKFRPENPVNRAELLKILISARDLNPDFDKYRNCFPDVHEEWFARYVCYAVAQKWIQGYPDGSFRPAQAINKVEAIKMLINTQGILIPFTVSEKPYNDVNTSDWFAPYIKTAKDLGLLEETGSTFLPSQDMARAGISENIYRAIKDQ